MSRTNQPYVFDNLVEASVSSLEKIGQKIHTQDATQPFSNSNAAGSIRPMTFEEVGQRAAAFGRRCKAMLSQSA